MLLAAGEGPPALLTQIAALVVAGAVIGYACARLRVREGSSWVHLRVCTSCGHGGCCDSFPGRHAAAHADSAGHPVLCSAEPGEDWGWCYPDRATLEPASASSSA